MKEIENLEGEYWINIVEDGVTDEYRISNFGRIKKIATRMNKNERLLRYNKSPNGYKVINFYTPNVIKTKKMYEHRLIAKYFIPNPLNKPYVNHLNNNPSDNRIENLEWCTQKENMVHSKNQNRISRGTNRWVSKLTEKDVIEIYRSNEHYKDLSKNYNVGEGSIFDIKAGRTWGWLTKSI